MNDEENDKGFVFSMDAAQAVFIVLIASTTIVTLITIPQETTSSSLYLSRLARDLIEVNRSTDDSLSNSDVGWIEINSCEDSDTVGSHEAVVYGSQGDLKTVKVEVCP